MNIYRFSDDYILKALRGDYSTKIAAPPSAAETVLIRLLAATMTVVSALIGCIGLIPILGAFLELIINNFPRGALGFYLRGSFYAPQFAAIGKNVLIDRGVNFWKPKNIHLGSNCHIDTNVKIEAQDTIRIGDYVHLGSNCLVQGVGTVSIGDFCGLGASSHLYSASNYYIDTTTPAKYPSMSAMAPADQQALKIAPIVLEPYSFVGVSATLFPGVTLGRGAIVAANSLVATSVAAEHVVMGIPAKTIARRPAR